MSEKRLTICAFVTFSCLLAATGTAEARTWKPAGKPAFNGDFQDVDGDNVRIKTVSGVESIPYTSLSRSDKAVVKSNLQSKGQRDVVTRLNQLDNAKKGEASKKDEATRDDNASESDAKDDDDESEKDEVKGDAGAAEESGGPAKKGERKWTDVSGNELTAEFVQVVGANVELRVDEKVQTYPISGFSIADQQWINAQKTDQPSTGAPAGLGGIPGAGFPGMMPPGGRGPGASAGPGMPGGFSGMMPPGMTPPGSGAPGVFPGMPPGMRGSGPPSGAGMPGGFSGMMPPGVSMTPGGPGSTSGFPGSSAPGFRGPGSSAGAGMPGGFPGAMSPNAGGSAPGSPGFPGGAKGSQPSSFPGAAGFSGPPGNAGGFPGATQGFGSGGPGMPGAFSSPSGPPAFEPPGSSGPPMGMDQEILKCEDCGAEFTAGSGLTEGDQCPKCSGGSSFSRINFRAGRGIVKIVIFVIALAAGGIGWIVKKASGTA